MSFTPDLTSTEDVLIAVLSAELAPLPAQEQAVGASTVSWWETDPGEIYIHAEGGTPDDRHYGASLVALALLPHGYRRASFDMDPEMTCAACNGQGWFRGTGENCDHCNGNGTVEAPEPPEAQGTNKYQGSADPAWGWNKARQLQEYGMQFQSYGDAAGRGYNGGYAAYHPETGEYMGHIDYNSYDGQAQIADIQTHPDHRRKGVATRLFDYAQRYDPEMRWHHGMTTPEGEAWRRSLGHRTSSWPDIMAKAKRLIQSNQVQVLRNGYQNIIGHVIGDHGEYDTEISRDDPESRSITGWQCSCPWDQYAWQRTRKWKKFEGRPCAHVMALYWKALQTPIDEEMDQGQAEGMGTGQAIHDDGLPPEGAKTEGPGPDSHEHKLPASDLPRSFSPEGDIIQGDQLPMNQPPDATGEPPGPAQAPLAPPPGQGPPGGPPPEGGPTPPGILPAFPGAPPEQPWAGPGTTPGGGVSPPGAYTVPGAKPPLQPANPLQSPGTYSRVARPGGMPGPSVPWTVGRHWQTGRDPNVDSEALMAQAAEQGQSVGLRPAGRLMGSAHTDVSTVRTDIWQTEVDAIENNWSAVPRFAAQGNEVHVPGVPIEDVQGIHAPIVSADFNAPQVVRLKNDMMGVAEGPVPGQYGDGAYREVPAGNTGEVLSQDPTTGWVEAIFALDDSGNHEPFHVRCFLEPSDIEATDQANAFIQRKTKTACYTGEDMPVLGASIHADEAEVAFILQKYAGQVNDPGHQLWFRPSLRRDAEPGRGLIHDPSGRVHTWPESEATHASMLHLHGYQDQDCTRFYIQPNGVVAQIMGPSSAFTTIMDADPSLARANGY